MPDLFHAPPKTGSAAPYPGIEAQRLCDPLPVAERAAGDGGAGAVTAAATGATGVVPMEGPRTRVLVRLEAGTAGGAPRPVRALVDTGGGAMVIRRQLAEELDLTMGTTIPSGAEDLETVEPPELSANGYDLDTDGLAAYVVDDGDHGNPLRAELADLNLPASLLRRHHLVLDVPAGLVTFGDPGGGEERGVRLPVGVHPQTGFVRSEITVDGQTHGVLVDSGPSCSLVVDHLYRAWQARHPEWPAAAASVGPANMAGIPAEARLPMLRVAALEWGPFTVPGVAVAWRADAAFGDLVAPGATAPVVGALGGNVLRGFRIELDYRRSEMWLEQGAPIEPDDTDMVGMVLVREAGEAVPTGTGYRVAAAVTGLGEVRVGDRLVAVDGEPVAPLGLAEVVALLAGEPGSTRPVTIERDNGLVQVEAPVTRVL